MTMAVAASKGEEVKDVDTGFEVVRDASNINDEDIAILLYD